MTNEVTGAANEFEEGNDLVGHGLVVKGLVGVGRVAVTPAVKGGHAVVLGETGANGVQQ